MLTRRLSLIAVAAAFAVSSSAALLQSSRPALADADDHHPRVHRHVGDRDRDDRRAHPGYHWANGQWIPNNYANNGGHWVNGQWIPNNANWNNPGKHKGWKHKKNHDRDHDHDRR
jgi:hypothetical protein